MTGMQEILDTLAHFKKTLSCDSITFDFDILQSLAKEGKHITELGVRHGLSFYAWLSGSPDKIVGVDIVSYPVWKDLARLGNEIGTEVQLIVSDDLKVDIEQTDILFVDSEHTYSHVAPLLRLHHKKVNKYIVMHDVYDINGNVGNCATRGQVHRAMVEFLEQHPEWEECGWTRPCGLAILKRKE